MQRRPRATTGTDSLYNLGPVHRELASASCFPEPGVGGNRLPPAYEAGSQACGRASGLADLEVGKSSGVADPSRLGLGGPEARLQCWDRCSGIYWAGQAD